MQQERKDATRGGAGVVAGFAASVCDNFALKFEATI